MIMTFHKDKSVFLASSSGFWRVESSGVRNEIRLFFQTSDQQQQREVFPYSLADGHWHKVSLAFSATQVVLHIDCNRWMAWEPPEIDLNAM